MIDPNDVMRRYSVEELCETADEYYRAVTDPTPLGLLPSGLHLGKTMTALDFGTTLAA